MSGAAHHDVETAVAGGSNGSATLTAAVAALAPPSLHPSRVLPTIAASANGIVAGDALVRALRHVPYTVVSVVGAQAAVMANWLRRNGHAAEALKPQSQRATKAPAILAPDLVESPADVPEAFAGLKQMLAPDGVLITVVPNLMHARTRIAVLLGKYQTRSNGGGGLTVGDVERMLHDAAFTIIDVERQVDSRDALQEMSDGVPESVVQMLANDLDAMTSHFVVVAEPTTSDSVSRCHRRISEISTAFRDTTREMARVEGRVADLEVRVQHWASETDRLALRDVTQAAGALTQADKRLEDEMRGLNERLASDRASDAERELILTRAREAVLSRMGAIKTLTSRIERLRYRREVLRIRHAVVRHVPAGSIVAVVSRGDDDLVAFDRRRGWHFPRTEKGVYAGHHPADSQAAIAHLETVRARGAQYLLIPRSGFWWLDHYTDFRDYLQNRCRRVWRDERTCVLYALGSRRAAT
jgi:hypothetical protein